MRSDSENVSITLDGVIARRCPFTGFTEVTATGSPRSTVGGLTEIVDESAAPPKRDTLLWYRLACALPAQLPSAAIEKMSETDAAGAIEDYAFVLRSLGRCTRN